jgi:hypothetical protein
MEFDFDSADASSFLEFSEVKFWTEKSFCLPENCADDIGFFNYTFNFKSSVYNVLYRKGLGLSRKYATPVSYYLLDYVNRIMRVILAMMRF